MSVNRNAGWDFLVDSRDGQPVLIVEAKNKLNASPEWAAQLRRNILAHGTFPKAPYFLIAFPDKFYLWTQADVQSEQSEPTYSIDGRPILQPYFEKAGVTPNRISGESFELIVASWLGEMMFSKSAVEDVDKSQQWLIESGLSAVLAGGKFEQEAAA